MSLKLIHFFPIQFFSLPKYCSKREWYGENRMSFKLILVFRIPCFLFGNYFRILTPSMQHVVHVHRHRDEINVYFMKVQYITQLR